jgi:hypothetical protein
MRCWPKFGRQPQNNGAELILLGEHVDYSNYIDWTDRFSSAQLSHRQSGFARDFHVASPYTPQMVIDGHVQFVGNNLDDVCQKIAWEAKRPKPAQVSLEWSGSDRLHAAVQSAAAEKAQSLLSVPEAGLSTAGGGGENSGPTLHHTAVARQLREFGSTDLGAGKDKIRDDGRRAAQPSVGRCAIESRGAGAGFGYRADSGCRRNCLAEFGQRC